MTIERNGCVSVAEIDALRATVGWDGGQYERSLPRFHSYYTVRADGCLVGFLAVVSDGVTNALLVDVIVHPQWQRQGIGKAMVGRAVDDLRADGIRCIQVTFAARLEEFYRSCGFCVSLGGYIDFKTDTTRDLRSQI